MPGSQQEHSGAPSGGDASRLAFAVVRSVLASPTPRKLDYDHADDTNAEADDTDGKWEIAHSRRRRAQTADNGARVDTLSTQALQQRSLQKQQNLGPGGEPASKSGRGYTIVSSPHQRPRASTCSPQTHSPGKAFAANVSAVDAAPQAHDAPPTSAAADASSAVEAVASVMTAVPTGAATIASHGAAVSTLEPLDAADPAPQSSSANVLPVATGVTTVQPVESGQLNAETALPAYAVGQDLTMILGVYPTTVAVSPEYMAALYCVHQHMHELQIMVHHHQEQLLRTLHDNADQRGKAHRRRLQAKQTQKPDSTARSALLMSNPLPLEREMAQTLGTAVPERVATATTPLLDFSVTQFHELAVFAGADTCEGVGIGHRRVNLVESPPSYKSPPPRAEFASALQEARTKLRNSYDLDGANKELIKLLDVARNLARIVEQPAASVARASGKHKQVAAPSSSPEVSVHAWIWAAIARQHRLLAAQNLANRTQHLLAAGSYALEGLLVSRGSSPTIAVECFHILAAAVAADLVPVRVLERSVREWAKAHQHVPKSQPDGLAEQQAHAFASGARLCSPSIAANLLKSDESVMLICRCATGAKGMEKASRATIYALHALMCGGCCDWDSPVATGPDGVNLVECAVMLVTAVADRLRSPTFAGLTHAQPSSMMDELYVVTESAHLLRVAAALAASQPVPISAALLDDLRAAGAHDWWPRLPRATTAMRTAFPFRSDSPLLLPMDPAAALFLLLKPSASESALAPLHGSGSSDVSTFTDAMSANIGALEQAMAVVRSWWSELSRWVSPALTVTQVQSGSAERMSERQFWIASRVVAVCAAVAEEAARCAIASAQVSRLSRGDSVGDLCARAGNIYSDAMCAAVEAKAVFEAALQAAIALPTAPTASRLVQLARATVLCASAAEVRARVSRWGLHGATGCADVLASGFDFVARAVALLDSVATTKSCVQIAIADVFAACGSAVVVAEGHSHRLAGSGPCNGWEAASRVLQQARMPVRRAPVSSVPPVAVSATEALTGSTCSAELTSSSPTTPMSDSSSSSAVSVALLRTRLDAAEQALHHYRGVFQRGAVVDVEGLRQTAIAARHSAMLATIELANSGDGRFWALIPQLASLVDAHLQTDADTAAMADLRSLDSYVPAVSILPARLDTPDIVESTPPARSPTHPTTALHEWRTPRTCMGDDAALVEIAAAKIEAWAATPLHQCTSARAAARVIVAHALQAYQRVGELCCAAATLTDDSDNAGEALLVLAAAATAQFANVYICAAHRAGASVGTGGSNNAARASSSASCLSSLLRRTHNSDGGCDTFFGAELSKLSLFGATVASGDKATQWHPLNAPRFAIARAWWLAVAHNSIRG